MYETILLPVDGSAYGDWARRLAVQLLAPQGTIRLLHVIDIVAIEGSFLQDLAGAVGAEPFLNLSPKLERILREKGEAVLAIHQSACEAAGVRCEAVLETGIVSSVIAAKAAEADVVILGRHGRHERFRAGLAGSTAEGVLRRSPKPVIIVPAEPKPLQSVCLGYDGSAHARHAMDVAEQICKKRSLPLSVVIAGKDMLAIEPVQEEVAKRVGGSSHPIEIHAREGKVHEVLVAAAGSHDLFVMGAYGHNRIVELVLGSTTEYMLRNAPVPTLFIR
jgi:nucleotide-binding universal stress UspA family protein